MKNLQDCHSNCLRVPHVKDELERNTEAYQSKEVDKNSTDDDNDEKMEEDLVNGQELDQLLDMLNEKTDSCSQNNINSDNIPHKLNLRTLREKGVLNCGYESIILKDIKKNINSAIQNVGPSSSELANELADIDNHDTELPQ